MVLYVETTDMAEQDPGPVLCHHCEKLCTGGAGCRSVSFPVVPWACREPYTPAARTEMLGGTNPALPVNNKVHRRTLATQYQLGRQ